MDMSEKFNIKPKPNMTQEEQEQKEKLFAMFDRAMEPHVSSSPEALLVPCKDSKGNWRAIPAIRDKGKART